MNNKIGLVTMCRKAGKLVMGMDMVKDACNTGKACAVLNYQLKKYMMIM